MTPTRTDQKTRRVLFQQFALIGHAFASPARLGIVSLLAHGEKTVDQLAQSTGQSLAATSAHLKVLRAASLVQSDKRGRHVHCRLTDDSVAKLWLELRTVGEGLLPEVRDVVRQFNEDPNSLAKLTPAELAIELAHNRVTLIDLRPADEFATGHLPGARNVPFAQLANLAPSAVDLPAGKPVYAYCRGPYCVMAREGTRRLRELGVPASRLTFSVPEWNAAHRARPTPSTRPSSEISSSL